MLYHYIRHQKDVVTRRTRYDLDKAEARAHILEGLLKALDHIDEIVRPDQGSPDTRRRARSADGRASASPKNRRRRSSTCGWRASPAWSAISSPTNIAQLPEQIAYLKSLLADEALLMGVIKDELREIRDKFADERRTELTALEGEIDIEDLIQPDDMVVTLTNFGYIKRLPKSTYRAQNRGGRGVSGMTTREEDFVRRLIIVNTHEEIMFFTNRGRVYSLKCYQIPEAGRTARGIAIVNLLALPGRRKGDRDDPRAQRRH